MDEHGLRRQLWRPLSSLLRSPVRVRRGERERAHVVELHISRE